MAVQTQQRARCAFCDAEGVSKEHVWAKSLTKLFDEDGEGGDTHIIRHVYSHPERGIEDRVKRAKTFAVIARKFCRDCNSG